MTDSDTYYVKRCLNGHPNDFRHLVRRYQTALLAYLAPRLGGKDMAEEVAQETLVRAYFNLANLEKQKSFFSWLLGIANLVVKEQQRDKQRSRRLAASLAQNVPGSRPNHTYPLARTIGKLPDSYQELILLRYYSGLSCKDIAQQQGMPLGTVTKTLSRAYDMLRKLLSQQNGTENCEVLT